MALFYKPTFWLVSAAGFIGCVARCIVSGSFWKFLKISYLPYCLKIPALVF